MKKFFRNTRSSLVIMGLFMMQLVTGIWFTFNKANFYEIAQNSGFACVLAPAVIIFSVWESGYGARYCVDFAWQMLMGALIIAFHIWEKAGKNTGRHLNKIMAAACLVCLILTFSQTMCWMLDGNLSNQWRMSLLSFGRLFEFWR